MIVAAWAPEDRERQDRHGDLGVHGLLAPARGEWAGYKKVFDFSSWSSDQISWCCETNTSHTRCTDSSSNVLWKNISRVFPCFGVQLFLWYGRDRRSPQLGPRCEQHFVGNTCREALDLFPPARSVGRVLIIRARISYLVR